MVDQRVCRSFVSTSIIVGESECVRVNVELLWKVLVVWLLERGHGAHSAAGGGQTGLKISLDPAHPKARECLANVMTGARSTQWRT